MMRLVALLMLLAAAAHAEPATLPTTLKEGDVLRGRFSQERHMQGFANPIRSEGVFVVAPGRGLIWQAETPFAVTTVVTPSGLVQSVNGTETTRLPSSRLPFLAKLYDMMAGALAGDWRALEASFAVSRSEAKVALIPLRPDDPTATQIAGITARIGRFVDEVEIRKPNGDVDRLSFRDQVLNGRALDAAETAILQ